MKIKKAFIYFISFFSLSLMFSACYYLSYKNALKQFNENAVEQNSELILSLQNKGLLQGKDQQSTDDTGTEVQNQEMILNADNDNTGADNEETSIAVDIVTEDTILPTTQYTLQVYDIKNGVMDEELLSTPSYLVGLTRKEVIEYLYNYMLDMPLSEFEKGLSSFELMAFSKQDVVLRKTYNIDKVNDQYYLQSENGYIVVYYGDQKTVFDYTSVSVESLTQYEQLQLEEGIFVKDLDELYAVLENYSS